MFKVSSEKATDRGILYVLLIDLEDKTLVKVGVTTRSKVEERVVEVLTSIWKSYRRFPSCYIKRFRTVPDVYSKEAALHKFLEEYRYETEHKFSGYTEMFDIPPDMVVNSYESMLKGTLPEEDWDRCSVCNKNKQFAVKVDTGLRYTCGTDCEHEGKVDE